MTISPGARLGPYEIVSAIGAGGMCEVYRSSMATSLLERSGFEKVTKGLESLNNLFCARVALVGQSVQSRCLDEKSTEPLRPEGFRKDLVVPFREGRKLARVGAATNG